ncbi:TerB N-terminal domain-containing protein [Acaryochloris sp. IP29b_bin.137]|uniref:TerB N-terminal domain-containing protein n=1 Tax=Acaryochloris sp. IP29b_bin.137 TaxID=2969217 RepID=UPI00262447FE|nr:TerB N-terminal domain-containing protein [Acaryochloris sp. IP29b_bin.137]
MGIVNWLKRVLEPKRPRSSPSSSSQTLTPVPEATSASPENFAKSPQASPVEPILDAQSTTGPTAVLAEPAPLVREVPQPDIQITAPSRATWVPGGETVQVGSYSLPGFVYVGDHLKGISTHVSTEPALIRPQLKLDEAKPDRKGHWISEWPSYSEIPSASRAAYLEWLADGRCDPHIPIGYVYLFFYGLERRVLRDLRRAKRPILAELHTIMVETERLQNLYGDQAAFGEETRQFLEICRFLGPKQITDLYPPWTFESVEMPLSLEVGLGTLAATQTPLPADWALSWAMHAFPTRLRTPASRCFPELCAWFNRKYHQTFGEGLLLEPDQEQTLAAQTITYQPTSVSFGGAIKLDIPELPKITHSEEILGRILPLLEAGMQTLDPYSRWLGRNPEGRGSYSALLLLPQELMADFASAQVQTFQVWTETRLSEKDMAVIMGQDLLQQWQDSPTGKLTKSEATVLSDYLTRLGIGIEPDVQLGGKPPTANQPCVLFRLPDIPLSELSEKYQLATLLLHLAVMVVVADDEVTVAESQRLQNYLASTPHLHNGERVRLNAHLQGLLADKLSLRGLKAKLQTLTSERKLAIAKFLIHLAAVDGDINAKEISILSKLYPLLGLETQAVFSHVHAMTVEGTPQTPIPTAANPVPSSTSSLQLDRALINAKVSESATVSALLADVFIEDPPNEEPEVIQGIAGLDQPHSRLLQHLGQQLTWPRQDLDSIVAELGLLLDGALELINEAAFEECDEPLTEGDDPITVDPDILQALLATAES